MGLLEDRDLFAQTRAISSDNMCQRCGIYVGYSFRDAVSSRSCLSSLAGCCGGGVDDDVRARLLVSEGLEVYRLDVHRRTILFWRQAALNRFGSWDLRLGRQVLLVCVEVEVG